jgi:hypothetical protein
VVLQRSCTFVRIEEGAIGRRTRPDHALACVGKGRSHRHPDVAVITSVTVGQTSVSEEEKAAAAGRVTFEGDVEIEGESPIDRLPSDDLSRIGPNIAVTRVKVTPQAGTYGRVENRCRSACYCFHPSTGGNASSKAGGPCLRGSDRR